MEVLNSLYQGLTGEEIAQETNTSINTVKSTIKRIYNKLNALNKTDAIRIAMGMELLKNESNQR
jgi:DNA-binding NarL/FixJ family response regulator